MLRGLLLMWITDLCEKVVVVHLFWFKIILCLLIFLVRLSSIQLFLVDIFLIQLAEGCIIIFNSQPAPSLIQLFHLVCPD